MKRQAAVFFALCLYAVTIMILAVGHARSADELGPPVDCKPGIDCFLQYLPDLGPGPGVTDPFCGTASYDGHDGTDIRVLSLTDLDPGIAVLSIANGVVGNIRDGMADKFVMTDVDRENIANRECGNGVAINHGNGLRSRYCHLKRGSIAVRSGDTVVKGQQIGKIGASGFVNFPHVEIELEQDGAPLDIITGRALGQQCDAVPNTNAPRLEKGFAAALGTGDSIVLSAGLSGRQYVHDELSRSGPPRTATTQDRITLGWAWFANLRKGDRVSIALTWPDGETHEEQTTDPLDRNKADYSLFVGKARAPVPGEYRLDGSVIRDGAKMKEFSRSFSVR